MVYYKQINNKLVEYTAEETTQRDAEIKAWEDDALNRALTQVRKTRNNKLIETDFYALVDVTMNDNMKTYRQELRDITNGLDTVDKCNEIKWPTKPTE